MSADNHLNAEPWYSDHRNLSCLWDFLTEQGDRPDDVAYFLEKPWKWDTEWERCKEALNAPGR